MAEAEPPTQTWLRPNIGGIGQWLRGGIFVGAYVYSIFVVLLSIYGEVRHRCHNLWDKVSKVKLKCCRGRGELVCLVIGSYLKLHAAHVITLNPESSCNREKVGPMRKRLLRLQVGLVKDSITFGILESTQFNQ